MNNLKIKTLTVPSKLKKSPKSVQENYQTPNTQNKAKQPKNQPFYQEKHRTKHRSKQTRSQNSRLRDNPKDQILRN